MTSPFTLTRLKRKSELDGQTDLKRTKEEEDLMDDNDLIDGPISTQLIDDLDSGDEPPTPHPISDTPSNAPIVGKSVEISEHRETLERVRALHNTAIDSLKSQVARLRNDVAELLESIQKLNDWKSDRAEGMLRKLYWFMQH